MPSACACNENYYGQADGASMTCLRCPARSTSPPGSTSPTDCTCDVGFFRQIHGSVFACVAPWWKTAESCDDSQYLMDDSANKSNWLCKACPPGGSCVGAVTRADIVQLFGFWQIPLDERAEPMDMFASCLNPAACLGKPNPAYENIYGALATKDTSRGSGSTCAKGYRGHRNTSRLCQQCEHHEQWTDFKQRRIHASRPTRDASAHKHRHR